MFSALKDQLIKAGLAPPVDTSKPAVDDRKAADRRPAGQKPGERQQARPDQGRPRPDANRGRTQPAPARPAGQRPAASAPARPKPTGEPDLRAAFAQRERAEQAEREAQRRASEEESRLRKAQRAELKHLLGQHTALNDPAAEVARNFLWGRKIRRTYVTAEQLRAVNAGELGIVAMDGRFSLYPAEVVRAVGAIDKHAVGLLVDPSAPVEEPDYDDPRYQVPDDLVW